MSNQGVFITFEGIEGCGKSTQLELLVTWLASRKLQCLQTREPGGTAAGAQIRKVLLSESSGALDPYAELFLYMADRFQHIAQVIAPALARGEVVLCDRYHDSTLAYQGYARGIPLDLLDYLWNKTGRALEPHHTILFDIDPETGVRRSLEKLRAASLDESRFEKENLGFHSKVRHGFLNLARLNPNRIAVIDAHGSIEDIQKKVNELVTKWLQIEDRK